MKILVLANNSQKEELSEGIGASASLVWFSEPGDLADSTEAAEACIDLLFDESEERIKLLKKIPSQIIIINAVLNPLNELTSRFIRFNGWNSFLKRSILEAAGTDTLLKQKAELVFSALGKRTTWVPNVAGFISPRVVASIINEAYFVLEEEVSTKDEIDTAMKLGTNYPYGPFEWCKKIGTNKVCSLLTRLAQEETRYLPSALLTREAQM